MDVVVPGKGQQGAAAELQEIEERLTETLNEVCDAPSVEKLDTGELIRVEETLAIAAETAKKAVSLRQKRHGEEPPSRPHQEPGR